MAKMPDQFKKKLPMSSAMRPGGAGTIAPPKPGGDKGKGGNPFGGAKAPPFGGGASKGPPKLPGMPKMASAPKGPSASKMPGMPKEPTMPKGKFR